MSKRYENLMKRIHAGENILLDGATGSELENRGIKMDNSWCGTAWCQFGAVWLQFGTVW